MPRSAVLLALTGAMIGAMIGAPLGAIACHVDPPLPPVASCDDVADHVYASFERKTAHARAVREAVAHRCEGDRWTEVTRACFTGQPAHDARKTCRETFTETQRTRFDAALAAVVAPPVAMTHAQPSEGCPLGAVPECGAYCDALGALADCQTLPPSARDLFREAWIQQMVAWGALPPDVQRAMCAQQLVALQRGAGCGP